MYQWIKQKIDWLIKDIISERLELFPADRKMLALIREARMNLAEEQASGEASLTKGERVLPEDITDQQIATRLGVELDVVQKFRLIAHESLPALLAGGGSPIDELPTPEGELLLKEQKEALQTAMLQLTPEQQHDLLGYYRDDLSQKEIGAQRGVSEGAVSLSRAEAEAKIGVLLRRKENLSKPLKPEIDPRSKFTRWRK